ncbi:hypothetical protein R1flu_016812 [Riccia fluitans]|uniref:Uncharacterized protein n=1 Tax=Riccia fluitans TaxID=41844 RepID=A0ABD1YMX0_9MARC
MMSPEEAIEKSLICISRAELPWERPDGGRRGVNEGPTWVDIPNVFRGIVYSANGSWTSDYKLGLIALQGELTNPQSWHKRHTPLLESDRGEHGPYGPGHARFIASPYNDGKVFCIYHATGNIDQGWDNRKARVLCLTADHFHPEARPLCCSGLGGAQQHSTGVASPARCRSQGFVPYG